MLAWLCEIVCGPNDALLVSSSVAALSPRAFPRASAAMGRPLARTTRWSGMITASGFSLTAAPTARYDFGFPRSRAISPLVTEVAKGTRESASHTLFWNSVPSGSSGTSKAVRFPAKYSRSSVAQRFESSVGRRVPASCTSPNATARTPRPLVQMVIGPWGVG